ncbi:cobalt/nickel transport system permease protein [Desulfobotulus alkaliphilus]|uniref:Cobalt/nickel transport system permease protein n=1 Tax=Desulfobotulus alkaliphilus TaxID=622671 RepID=A0A562RYV8_9BACT|nr:energy-coupling factor ABC transporter permease [Desulfobotulus alkaliphilus]TWI74311.1 cobalt/nickel transport system permease protein [Desulfobotulus alkaliphilus]
MHIPDAMISGPVCPATSILAAGLIGIAAFKAIRTDKKTGHSDKKTEPADFAAVTALIFVFQMLNFPISGATSGHLMGGVLAAGLLGVPAGILSISLVLLVQAVFFGDGGLTVLGMNILLMAGMGAGFGGLLRLILIKGRKSPLTVHLSTAFAAWISVMAAALLCCIFIAAGSDTRLSGIIGPMLSVHAIIALGEALLTLVLMSAARYFPRLILPMAAALFLTPFASGYPDGLEFVAENFALPEGILLFNAPMPDYSFPVLPESLSVMAAGLAGILICQILARGGIMLFKQISGSESKGE